MADNSKNLMPTTTADRELADMIESHRETMRVSGPVAGLLYAIKQKAIARATRAETERWQEQGNLAYAQTGVIRAYGQLHDAMLEYQARAEHHDELHKDKLAAIGHQLEIERLKRAEDLAKRQAATSHAQLDQQAHEQAQPDLLQLRAESLKARERALANMATRDELASETAVISARHDKLDVEDALTNHGKTPPPAPSSPSPTTPPASLDDLQAQLDVLNSSALTPEQRTALERIQDNISRLRMQSNR